MKKTMKISTLLSTIALISFVQASDINISDISQNLQKSTKIIGGTPVSSNDDTWRFVVALQTNDEFNHQFCAGSLIAPDWVLTAAHCVEDATSSEIHVGVGSYDRTQTTSHAIDNIIVHENYDYFTSDNDIALVHLSEPVNNINVVPYNTSSMLTAANTPTETAGWGVTDNHYTSDDLMEVLVPIVDRDTCNDKDAYDGDVTDNMLCAGLMQGGVDSCQGDSGGPLLVEDTIVGIVSWGYGCALENHPGVYTNVENYASWIEANMGDNSSNTVFETGHPYENNADVTQVLSIAEATSLNVTITGEVEANYDFIYIIDENGVETQYTGALNEAFSIQGHSITVRFTSDSSVVKNGAVVTIENGGGVEPSETVFETGHPYENNADVTQVLSIAEATSLNVTITGEVEANYDFIYIIDENGVETQYTGALNEAFSIRGHSITVRFTSDSSVVKNGAVVTIENGDMEPTL